MKRSYDSKNQVASSVFDWQSKGIRISVTSCSDYNIIRCFRGSRMVKTAKIVREKFAIEKAKEIRSFVMLNRMGLKVYDVHMKTMQYHQGSQGECYTFQAYCGTWYAWADGLMITCFDKVDCMDTVYYYKTHHTAPTRSVYFLNRKLTTCGRIQKLHQSMVCPLRRRKNGPNSRRKEKSVVRRQGFNIPVRQRRMMTQSKS